MLDPASAMGEQQQPHSYYEGGSGSNFCAQNNRAAYVRIPVPYTFSSMQAGICMALCPEIGKYF